MLQEQSKVQDFLNSVARNSEKTRQLYGFGLTHFQSFLSTDDSGKYSQFTAGSILTAVSNNQINVYTLIDDFVSYLVTKHKNKLSPNAIALYVALSVHIYSIMILILFLPSLRDESSYLKTTEKTSRLLMLPIFVKFYYPVIIEGLKHTC